MLQFSNKINKNVILATSYVITVIVAMIVFLTGGTSKVYPHFMYIPISIVASTNGKIQGVIHGAVSGFLLGPFMPLNVTTMEYQPINNWVFRMIMFITIAFVIGFFADYNKQQFEITNKKDREIVSAQTSMIYSLVKLTESRDDYTGKHIERVAEYCKLLAEKLGETKEYKGYVDQDFVDHIHMAAPLHDIGKVGIPDRILLKPGKLSEEEFEVMKSHTTIGANTLLEVKKKYPENMLLDMGISIAHYHHEKWNGSGYPEGLSGRDIPLEARIMALADAYDALRSKRVYKEPLSHEKTVDIIKKDSGSHFDPDIVNIFLQNEDEFRKIYEFYQEDHCALETAI